MDAHTAASSGHVSVPPWVGRAGALLFWAACAVTPVLAQTADDFFDDRLVQEVRLYINPSDWATLKRDYLDNTYYPADFEWKYQGRWIELPDIRIRSRGTGSRSAVKPGLRVDVNRDEPGRNFLGLKSFQLRNLSQDASLIHDRLSMVFFRRLGIPAPRMAHARVYVNKEYIGLYTLCESVDKSLLSRVFGENDGYLYKYDDEWRAGYYFEYRGSDPALYSPDPFKPETHEKDPDPRPIEAMVRAINQSADADFVNTVSEFLDLRQFMTHVAVERFLGEQDGVVGAWGMNNFYLYRLEKKNLSRLIAWDKDLAFGAPPGESIWRFISDVPEEKQNRLMRRALKVPELKAAYLCALARSAAIAGGEGGFLSKEIDSEYGQIQKDAREDRNKQCYDSQGVIGSCSNESFEAAILSLKEFLRFRSNGVLNEVGRNMEALSDRSFTLPDRGGVTWTTLGVGSAPTVGYARLLPSASSSPAAGQAIFGYRQNNVLVTEAGVPLTPGLRSGRIYAEVRGAVSTGLAIVNPNDEPVKLSFYFTDQDGRDFGHGATTLEPRSQRAGYLSDAPYNGGRDLHGSFTFSASLPVSALALRLLTNERSEQLVTTLPVIEPVALSQDIVILPHFADGGGWITRIMLLNPTDSPQKGSVEFYGQGSGTSAAQRVEVTIAGTTASGFKYELPPRSARLLVTAGGAGATNVGSVRIFPDEGSSAPAASLVLSYKPFAVTVTEAGAAAVPRAAAFRLYAELLGKTGETGSIQSGLALANPGENTLSVRLQLTDMAGKIQGPESGALLSIPPQGQVAVLLSGIAGFEAIKTPFQGILRVIASAPSGVAILGLRGRYNERGDYLITTTPPVPDQATGDASSEAYLPHWVDGGGYTTQFLLLGSSAGTVTGGILRTASQSGKPLPLIVW